jgi:DmsE family decaheme c-type cytochrome
MGWKAWLICGFVAWTAALVGMRASTATTNATSQVAKKSTAPRQNPAQPVAGGAALVGDDKCIVCHADKGEVMAKTPHGQKADVRTPAAKQGCETCHGPGSKHADDPANVKMPVVFTQATSSADINATCTSCHNRGPHALWDGSKHETRGLACTSCHSVHDFKSESHQLKAKDELALCATCHRDKVAKMDLPAHMPVREGKMTCTSCHDPHGTTNVKLLRVGDNITELCTSCHKEKRGPFLWEHAPVSEGCTTCHDPHGSVNERMLVTKLPMLCQRCHISTRHPATVYDSTQLTSNRLFGRACVNCHYNIHGSNHPSGQFFTR